MEDQSFPYPPSEMDVLHKAYVRILKNEFKELQLLFVPLLRNILDLFHEYGSNYQIHQEDFPYRPGKRVRKRKLTYYEDEYSLESNSFILQVEMKKDYLIYSIISGNELVYFARKERGETINKEEWAPMQTILKKHLIKGYTLLED